MTPETEGPELRPSRRVDISDMAWADPLDQARPLTPLQQLEQHLARSLRLPRGQKVETARLTLSLIDQLLLQHRTERFIDALCPNNKEIAKFLKADWRRFGPRVDPLLPQGQAEYVVDE
ncbi:MAG TPA: hypothetical protein VFG53_19905 [Anaeromyxobacter sp.]|nr:hypothetical protein [Anaeromyxobacter sp.]